MPAVSEIVPIRALRWPWAWSMVIAALALIFALDHGVGAPAVEHLYYAPIILASVRFGYAASLAVATAAIALYHLANPHVLTLQYEESDLVQILLFVAVGAVSARIASDARRLRRLALTDDLTGLHNLRSFEAHLRALVRACRQGSPLALLVLDVDRLKSLNDVHGHRAGADAVRTVGHVIADCVPSRAIACRFGGDEFVIALPDCTESQAQGIADGLRLEVNATPPVLAGVQFPAETLSISIGIACLSFEREAQVVGSAADDSVSEELFQAADAALYVAKAKGRNRVSLAPPIVKSPPSTVRPIR